LIFSFIFISKFNILNYGRARLVPWIFTSSLIQLVIDYLGHGARWCSSRGTRPGSWTKYNVETPCPNGTCCLG